MLMYNVLLGFTIEIEMEADGWELEEAYKEALNYDLLHFTN